MAIALLLTLTALATAAMTVAFLVVGMGGRRVGDHPYCAACGYDLFGRPADATRCGECGSALDRPGAVVVGRRVRRLLPLAAGGVLAAMTVGLVALLWLTRQPMAGGVSVASMSSAALLACVNNTSNAVPGLAATSELVRRVDGGTLGVADRNAAVAGVLRNGPTASTFAGNGFVEAMIQRGHVRAATSEAYVRGMTQAGAGVQSRMAVTFDALLNPLSAGGSMRGVTPGLLVGLVRGTVRAADGATLYALPATSVSTANPWPNAHFVPDEAELANRRGEVKATVEYAFDFGLPNGPVRVTRPLALVVVAPSQSPGLRRSPTGLATPKAVPTGVFGRDLDRRVADAVTLKSFRERPGGGADVEVEIGPVPENVSFGLFATHRQVNSRYGFALRRPGDGPRAYAFRIDAGMPIPAGRKPGRTEVRLGSDDDAPRDLGLTRYWARDVVFTIPPGGDAAAAAKKVVPAMQKPRGPRVDLDAPTAGPATNPSSRPGLP